MTISRRAFLKGTAAAFTVKGGLFGGHVEAVEEFPAGGYINPRDGGFLIPEEYRADIFNLLYGPGVGRPLGIVRMPAQIVSMKPDAAEIARARLEALGPIPPFDIFVTGPVNTGPAIASPGSDVLTFENLRKMIDGMGENDKDFEARQRRAADFQKRWLDKLSEITFSSPREIPSPAKERKMALKNWSAALATEITDALKRGEKVTLPGIGVLKVIDKAARIARNPATGAQVQVPAKKAVKLSQSTGLAAALNGG